MSITHYGYNQTHMGHYLKPYGWSPVPKDKPLGSVLLNLVQNTPRICRIWVLFENGESKCVYWYEHPTLKDINQLEN